MSEPWLVKAWYVLILMQQWLLLGLKWASLVLLVAVLFGITLGVALGKYFKDGGISRSEGDE